MKGLLARSPKAAAGIGEPDSHGGNPGETMEQSGEACFQALVGS